MRLPLTVQLACALILLAAAPALAAPAPPSCDEETFNRLVQECTAGNESNLRTYAETCTASPFRAAALRQLARFAFERGRFGEAVATLHLLPPAERLPGDTLFEGAALVAEGRDVPAGMALLRQLDPAALAPDERVRRLTALADGALLGGDKTGALASLNAAAALAGEGDLARICRLARPLGAGLSDEELAKAIASFGTTPVRLDLSLELARRAAQKKDPATAKLLLEEILAANSPYPYRGEALALRDQLEGGAWLRRAVGVLLPLSGKYAPFGEAFRRGMELALAERTPRQRSIAFLFRDVGPEGEENRRAVQHLVEDERVMALVGPLTGSAAQAAAEAAQQERTPLLSLAQREGIPEIGDYVFRDSLTNRKQLAALVRYACDRQGAKRFAVLAPRTRLGQDLTELFTQLVQKCGGTVVASQSYEENAIDFRTPVKLLKGEDPKVPDPTDKEARRRVVTAPRTPPPFDALFIPDGGERVGMIAPYLAYYGIEEVLLLGTSAWNSPELLAKGGRYLDGAVFTDGFFAGSEDPAVQDFVKRYQEQYGDEPSILEAEGYDLARFFLGLLDRPEIRSRSELRTALERQRPLPGVTGSLAFDAVGDSTKPVLLLHIENGALVPLPEGG